MNPEMSKIVEDILKKVDINSSKFGNIVACFKHYLGNIVGMHIRRTDKKLEAKYYPIEDYFKYAEGFFQIQERRNVGTTIKRRVYIATDEPDVIDEAKKK
jgi:hypothetical protein